MSSVVGRVYPTLGTVSELVILLPSPTPEMASPSSEANPLKTTVRRIKLRVQKVEKGVEKQAISKLEIPRKLEQDDYSPGESFRHERDGEANDSG